MPDGDPDVDPTALGAATTDDVAQEVGEDAVAGTVELSDGTELPVALDGDIVDAAREHPDVDIDDIRASAVPSGMDFAWSSSTQATAQQDSTSTIPVQSERTTDFSRRGRDADSAFIHDEQIQRLRQNSINYTQRVGRWLLRTDDLIPSVKERLKALITGEDGLDVAPKDPDKEADQRLAEHLRTVYGDDVRPSQVIDAILRENLMNARGVVRATDLNEIDLSTLTYLKDGVTGEEIYIQRNTAVHTFDIQNQDSDSPDIDIDREVIDEQPLIIGEQVFDVSLYDTPPLEAVADTAVNKMVLQRLKARKAEITSFGAVYAKVEAPSYLPEDQYFDRVQDDDFDGDGPAPTKLERALKSNLQKAFDTLKDFQSGTVMSVPDYWTLEQLQIPETSDSLDDQIRGYNRDIARRMLVPLDLIELREGAEMSRETMFRTLMTTIAGWRQEIKRVFDQFAQVQADIHDVPGQVEHSFPPLHDEPVEEILQALQFAGVAGLSQKEARQMLNSIRGVDLTTDEPSLTDGLDDAPGDGGPADPAEREDAMNSFLAESQRGASAFDDQDGSDPAGIAAQADDSVVFGNVGGDPFGDQDVLEAFVDALFDAGADDVRLGNESWPDVSGIHDRPVAADGLSVDAALDVWADFEDDSAALMGPKAQAAQDDADDFQATLFQVVAADDDDRFASDVLGIGIDFPNSDVYVDWRNSVFPDELDEPHVSVYGSISDLERATGNVVERLDTVSIEAATTLVDPDAVVDVEQVDASAVDVPDDWDGSVEAAHNLRGFDSLREAAHHVRRIVDRRIERGKTVEVERRPDDRFAVLVRGPDGGFRGSVLLQESDTDPDAFVVVGSSGILTDLRLDDPAGAD